MPQIEHRPFTTIGRKKDKIYQWYVNRKCDHCGERMLPEGHEQTPAVFVTEQTSVMRGDDVVKIYHPQCFTEGKS